MAKKNKENVLDLLRLFQWIFGVGTVLISLLLIIPPTKGRIIG